MKRAQALAPWMSPNMFYGGGDRNSQLSSYQLNPLLQQDVSLQNSLPLVQPQAQLSPNRGVLDYLESEIQNLNMSQLRPPSHQRQAVQPSLLSSLGSEIMPPPLADHISSIHGSSNSSRPQRATRTPRPWDSAAEDRRENWRQHLPSSGGSHSSYSREPWDRQREDHPQRQRTGGYSDRPQHSRRDVSPPRGKSSSSSCSFYPEEAKERSSHHRGWRQEPRGRQDYQHHTRRSNNSEVHSKSIFERDRRDWLVIPDAIAAYIYETVNKMSPKVGQFLVDAAQTPVVVVTRNFLIRETTKLSILAEQLMEKIKNLWYTKVLGY
ncbi:immunoglobulin-like domain-containing receptor 1 [Grus japonensis]